MQYVKGFINKQHGPFVAKERFEGTAKNVFDKGDHYIIQGVKIPKEQIEVVATCSLLKETLDMAVLVGIVERRKPRAKKVVEVDPTLAQYERIKRNWTEALIETVKIAKSRKRLIDYSVLDILAEKVQFLDVTLKYAIKDGDTSTKKRCINGVQSLYVTAIDTIENSKTPGQQTRELIAAFCHA